MRGERYQPVSLKVLYSEDMVSDSGIRASPSDKKPRMVSEALLSTAWPVELIAPEPTTVADLGKVHDLTFVEDVLQMKRRNGFGSLSPSVAHSLLYTCGACYCSARVALKDGISASLTSGFHHAATRAGRGFCTFNGLMATTVQLLDEGRVEKVAIVDCDYHYGDGTQEIIDVKALASRVLHLSFGRTFRKPEQAEDYLAAVWELRAKFEDFQPDLVIYQAGADVHIDDPLGGLLTTDQMRARDRAVFSIGRELSIPITWNLAGGYQVELDGSIPRVVQLHINTFEEALKVWQLLP
jgi:acetoin utilization deacetylase AcuC-like enzyme